MSEYTEFINGIPVHPYAASFDMMSDDELQALADDIKANGQHEPIFIAHMHENGMENPVILDGRNRYAACKLAGVEPKFQTLHMLNPLTEHSSLESGRGEVELTEENIRRWIRSKNVHRRHMTREQRREYIKDEISANPDLPDYRIAKRVGASPHTVKRVREANPDLQVANEERVNARGQIRPATYTKNEADEVLEARDKADHLKAEGSKLTHLLEQLKPGADASSAVPAVLADRWVLRAIQLGSLTPIEALMSALRLQDEQPPTTDDEQAIDALMTGLITRTGRWINGFNPEIPLPEAYENWAGEETQ